METAETDTIAELRLGKINFLAVGKMRWESERLWAEIPRRELGEVPLGRREGLSRRGGRRRWERCFDKTWQREGLEGKGGREESGQRLFTVNCPAFQMSPEDIATISMQPDSAQ